MALAAVAMPACDDDDTVDDMVEITNANTYTPYHGSSEGFASGADVSWVTEMEDNGVKFYSADGVETECMALLKSLGVDAIRLRVWVNPASGYCDKDDVVAKAMRANALGLNLMIDFHYSDVWADPSNQEKPEAWKDYTYDELKAAVADHTTDVLSTLKEKGVTPAWVQIGNEVGGGFLWGDGKASTNPGQFAELLTSGIDAAKAIFPDIKIVIHVQNGWNYNTTSWLMNILKSQKVEYDILGVSLYPEDVIKSYGNKYGTALDIVQITIDNMEALAVVYSKDMMVCEFGYSVDDPETGYNCLKKLVDAGKSSATIAGVFYWEPESYDWNGGYNKGAFGKYGSTANCYTPLKTLDAFAK